jgi:protein TonB
MTPHVDILEQPESLRRPLFSSLLLHAALTAALVLSSVVGGGTPEAWGDLNSGGPGSVAINVVNKIPLPSRGGTENPLANDTQSRVPAPPPKPKPQERAQPPEPDAIPLKSRSVPKRAAEPASKARWRHEKDRENQLYNEAGQALVSPMVGQTGSGGVGVGLGSPFGNRFGNYVTILQQRVAEKWRTADVDPRIKTAPPVIVTFTILRDGSVRSVRVGQGSGNPALDYSAQRAIYDASPFPPLPAGYERNDANVEFWFHLKR